MVNVFFALLLTSTTDCVPGGSLLRIDGRISKHRGFPGCRMVFDPDPASFDESKRSVSFLHFLRRADNPRHRVIFQPIENQLFSRDKEPQIVRPRALLPHLVTSHPMIQRLFLEHSLDAALPLRMCAVRNAEKPVEGHRRRSANTSSFTPNRSMGEFTRVGVSVCRFCAHI